VELSDANVAYAPQPTVWGEAVRDGTECASTADSRSAGASDRPVGRAFDISTKPSNQKDALTAGKNDFDEVTSYEDEDDHEPSDGHDDYEEWLRNELELDPVDDPASIVEAAQARHEAAFESWFKKYVTSE
jgi:hypothetical protein